MGQMLTSAEPQCVVTANKMIGPCHTNDVPIRLVVTEGLSALPMRVSLRIVKAGQCEPIEGADVDIWHADAHGVYSGREQPCVIPTTRPRETSLSCVADKSPAKAV